MHPPFDARPRKRTSNGMRIDNFTVEELYEWPENRWPDFERDEIACRCASACKWKNALLISTKTMDLLQSIRNKLGVSIAILSALRCPAHNKSVGGALKSRHIEGTAVDFSFKDIEPVEFAQVIAKDFKWRGGIGAYPQRYFIHVDSDLVRSIHGGPRHWIYRKPSGYTMVDFRDLKES